MADFHANYSALIREQFTMRSTPTRLIGYNFWTATGFRATVQMANASEIAKP